MIRWSQTLLWSNMKKVLETRDGHRTCHEVADSLGVNSGSGNPCDVRYWPVADICFALP
jgi:hypothetical protein